MTNIQALYRAAALSLSAFATLSVLASIEMIATGPAPDALVAAATPASQVIVIEGKRNS